jgi:outer membrane protein OmpA-like peptidoglycan-associated protein
VFDRDAAVKHLAWVILGAVVVAGAVLYMVQYRPLAGRLADRTRETEMWIAKIEQLKRDARLEETRQKLAPDVGFLLADVFPNQDSFGLTRYARDTLAALANEFRKSQGEIRITVFSDDSGTSLYTKLKYANALAYSAAKAAAVSRFLESQGIPSNRMVVVAYGQGRPRSATIPDLSTFAGRRLEISLRAAAR